MKVRYEKGYAIEKDCEIIINSANSLLMLGSSGAEKIRLISGEMTPEDIVEYEYYFKQLPTEIQKFVLHEYDEKEWVLKYGQLSSVKLLYNNQYPFQVGEAVLDKEWSKTDSRKIIHAITMGYSTSWPPQRVWGSVESIFESYCKAFEICKNLGVKSMALPLPVAREGYGIGAVESYRTVKKVLEEFLTLDIEVIVCFDNKDTEKLLETLIK